MYGVQYVSSDSLCHRELRNVFKSVIETKDEYVVIYLLCGTETRKDVSAIKLSFGVVRWTFLQPLKLLVLRLTRGPRGLTSFPCTIGFLTCSDSSHLRFAAPFCRLLFAMSIYDEGF